MGRRSGEPGGGRDGGPGEAGDGRGPLADLPPRAAGVVAVLGAIAAAAVFVVAGLLSRTAPGPAPDLQLATTAPSDSACTPVAPLPAGPGARIEGETVHLIANGYVRLATCAGGTLRFTARGTAAAGAGPLVTVTSGTSALWEGRARDEWAPVEVRLPGPGWVVIGFHDDEVTADGDRNLWLGAIELE